MRRVGRGTLESLIIDKPHLLLFNPIPVLSDLCFDMYTPTPLIVLVAPFLAGAASAVMWPGLRV